MQLDDGYWQERWESGETQWDMGTPSPALVDYCERLADKGIKILIPGAGSCYEADWLWDHGFRNFHVVDWAQGALDRVRLRRPDIPAENLLQSDFFELTGPYDLILEQTFFCALPPAMRPSYATKMASLLQPGGMLAGLLFDFPLTEVGPPFGGAASEYLSLFEPLFEVMRMEPCKNSIPPRAGRELFFELRRADLIKTAIFLFKDQRNSQW